MKAATIKGVAMLRVDKFGVFLNSLAIQDILTDALQPTEKELENYQAVPANILIQIEPIQTKLQVEHPGEPKLMEPVETRKVS